MYTELQQVWQEFTGPGGPFEVGEVTVRGVPIKAYTNAPANLRDIWVGSAGHGDADYLVYEDDRWTYTDAHRDVASIASWLVAQGIEPGDRVGIAMRNYPEWMLAYWGIISAGATVVGLNAWWTGPELLYGVQDAAPKVLICDQERLDRFLPIRDEAPACTVVGVRSEPGDGVVAWSELTGHDESGRA